MVITGSSRGLGRALAEHFLLSGDIVIISGRNHESLAAVVEELRPLLRYGGKILYHATDVASGEQVDALVAFACSQVGGVDCFIANAAVTQEVKAPLWETPEVVFKGIVGTNFLGILHSLRASIRAMRRQRTGGAVFMLDGAGSAGYGTPHSATYGATKAMLRQLMRSMTAECAGSGVGVHVVSPGMVQTELLLGKNRDEAKNPIPWALKVLADPADDVARWLVPRIRRIAMRGMVAVGNERKKIAEEGAQLTGLVAGGGSSGSANSNNDGNGRGSSLAAGGAVTPAAAASSTSTSSTSSLVHAKVRVNVSGTYLMYLTPWGVLARFAMWPIKDGWKKLLSKLPRKR